MSLAAKHNGRSALQADVMIWYSSWLDHAIPKLGKPRQVDKEKRVSWKSMPKRPRSPVGGNLAPPIGQTVGMAHDAPGVGTIFRIIGSQRMLGQSHETGPVNCLRLEEGRPIVVGAPPLHGGWANIDCS